MTGFPKTGTDTEIGHGSDESAGRGSLFPFVMHNKGPDRFKKRRHSKLQPDATGQILLLLLHSRSTEH